MTGSMDGVRIVEATMMLAGPIAARILGDQGADVIKVEVPRGGDVVRIMGPSRSGFSSIFANINRNKRSIALDLKKSEGVEWMKKLVSTADVFIQNFRPGAAKRIGIDEESLRAVKPDLIYVSISGFGATGHYADKKGYDPVVQALSGLASIQADAGTGRPGMVRLVIPDKITGMTAAQAIGAALFSRERTGQGQHVRVSMLDSVIAFHWPEGMSGHTWVGQGTASRKARIAQDLVFKTADGFITCGANSDLEWKNLCGVLERPEFLEDERFKTPASRMQYAPERLELMQEALLARTSKVWLDLLEAADVPCAPVVEREVLHENEQVIENQILIESRHPVGGEMRQPRPPEIMDLTPSEIRRPAPGLGEHTDEILVELGADSAEIEKLRAEEIVV